MIHMPIPTNLASLQKSLEDVESGRAKGLTMGMWRNGLIRVEVRRSGEGMDSKSSGSLGIKTTMGTDMRNAPPVEESRMVSAGPACCEVGPAGMSVTEKPASGSEGPGRGSAVRLNSDDQMPGPTYGGNA